MAPAKSLNGTPLSIYQVLALNALETPDEVDSVSGRPARLRDKDHRRMRDEPVRTDQTAGTGVAMGFGLGLGRIVGSESATPVASAISSRVMPSALAARRRASSSSAPAFSCRMAILTTDSDVLRP